MVASQHSLARVARGSAVLLALNRVGPTTSLAGPVTFPLLVDVAFATDADECHGGGSGSACTSAGVGAWRASLKGAGALNTVASNHPTSSSAVR